VETVVELDAHFMHDITCVMVEVLGDQHFLPLHKRQESDSHSGPEVVEGLVVLSMFQVGQHFLQHFSCRVPTAGVVESAPDLPGPCLGVGRGDVHWDVH
jgi:hypothetical protein